MYGIKAIVSKELRRVFKDKKMIMLSFIKAPFRYLLNRKNFSLLTRVYFRI